MAPRDLLTTLTALRYSPWVSRHTAATDISVTTNRINGFQVTVDSALTVLHTELLNYSITYFRGSYPQFVPYLVY